MDEKAVARAAGKIARTLAQLLIPVLRQLLLCFLLGTELLFLGNSLFRLVINGPTGVLAWWYHLQVENSPFESIRGSLSWPEFFVGHFVILGFAAMLFFYERRNQRRLKLSSTIAAYKEN